MKVLWFTWKDLSHPEAGGAEVINEELARRLVSEGHEVHFVVGGYEHAEPTANRDGYKITRLGNRYTVYWLAFRYYRKHLKGWADLVIDEVNTVPFFARFYVKEKSFLFVHQLAREIWYYQFKPLAPVGYLLEPLYLRLLSRSTVITVSQSTKDDLVSCGFKPSDVHIISEGIHTKPLAQLPAVSTKAKYPTLLSLGSVRPMKRTLHHIQAFEKAKQKLPQLRLIIAGDILGPYGEKVKRAAAKSQFSSSIEIAGRVSAQRKQKLMQQAHLVLFTSVREGWGLVVTEANSQGTPAVVYNVSGLRDSVRHNKTGIVTQKNTPDHLAQAVTTLLSQPKHYAPLRRAAWQWSKKITFTQSYNDFKKVIGL